MAQILDITTFLLPIITKLLLQPVYILQNIRTKMVNVFREEYIELYELIPDEKAWLYEIGIPVVKLHGSINWVVNVKQKIPQTTSRNVVSEVYLKDLYGAILNNAVDLIRTDDASATFVDIGMKLANKDV